MSEGEQVKADNLALMRDYRGFPGHWRRWGANVMRILLAHRMTEDSRVLDVGCGSLRIGRLLIPFLKPGKYCGIEPEKWMVEEGMARELAVEYGWDAVDYKRPEFTYNREFDLSAFEDGFDLAFAFQVFVHCGREQFAACLDSLWDRLSGPFLVNVNLGPETEEIEKDGVGRCYRAASHKGVVYKWDDLVKVATERQKRAWSLACVNPAQVRDSGKQTMSTWVRMEPVG